MRTDVVIWAWRPRFLVRAFEATPPLGPTSNRKPSTRGRREVETGFSRFWRRGLSGINPYIQALLAVSRFCWSYSLSFEQLWTRVGWRHRTKPYREFRPLLDDAMAF